MIESETLQQCIRTHTVFLDQRQRHSPQFVVQPWRGEHIVRVHRLHRVDDLAWARRADHLECTGNRSVVAQHPFGEMCVGIAGYHPRSAQSAHRFVQPDRVSQQP